MMIGLRAQADFLLLRLTPNSLFQEAPRNASLALLSETAAVPVQVLLELRGASQLGVLVTSREGMSRGAPFSRAVLEQVLAQLQTLVPGCSLHYRSDRDGPVEQVSACR
jgi:hypothetical protein